METTRSIFFFLLSTAILWIGINLAIKLICKTLANLTVRTRTKWDDAIIAALTSTSHRMIGLFSVLASTRFLPFGETVHLWLGRLLAFVIVYQVASWLGKVVDFIFRDLVERRTKEDGGAAATLGLLGFGIKVILITFVLLMGLRNIGVDITALITGLGLGGIAVGLALQNILGDLFASLAIVLDKPFVVGDFIVVGEFSGTVEHVGLKTTRVRSLSGEQLVFSNADLLQSRISNFQRMDRRRVQFTFKITYDASAEQLTWVPAQVKTILNNLEKVTFDRCHLKTLGDSSLEFETVYWVESADFNFYMDIQQKLNLEMLRSFRERKVQFAYPSQMLQIRSISSGEAPENDSPRRSILNTVSDRGDSHSASGSRHETSH